MTLGDLFACYLTDRSAKKIKAKKTVQDRVCFVEFVCVLFDDNCQ